MKRGFKSECESIAAAQRSELCLGATDPLDPRRLARSLGIPIHPLSSLQGEDVLEAVAHAQRETSILSGLTIFPDWPAPRRVIIFNDANSPGRQNSDLAHELSHGLLMHEPRAAIVAGCLNISKSEEEEAAWLSGCLLVPRTAAVSIAVRRIPIDIAAAEFGVSPELMNWRLNATGARMQATRRKIR